MPKAENVLRDFRALKQAQKNAVDTLRELKSGASTVMGIDGFRNSPDGQRIERQVELCDQQAMRAAEASIEALEKWRMVSMLLSQLESKYAAMLWLVYGKGLSVAEAGRQLGEEPPLTRDMARHRHDEALAILETKMPE